MALEQISGLNFRDKRTPLDVDKDAATDLGAALYNSIHFEIPHTFDVGIDVIDWLRLAERKEDARFKKVHSPQRVTVIISY